VSLKTREGIWKYIEQLVAQGRDGNPFSVLITLMLDSDDEHIRLHAATALCDRLLPRLKAVELSADPDHPPTVQVTLETRLAEALTQLETARNGTTSDTHERRFPGTVLR
jgi:hypothetical protein